MRFHVVRAARRIWVKITFGVSEKLPINWSYRLRNICVRYLRREGSKIERRQTGKQLRKMLRRKNRKIICHSTCVVTQLIYSRLLHHSSPKRKKTCWLTFPLRSRNKQVCVETVPCSVFARFNLRSDTVFVHLMIICPFIAELNCNEIPSWPLIEICAV